MMRNAIFMVLWIGFTSLYTAVLICDIRGEAGIWTLALDVFLVLLGWTLARKHAGEAELSHE